jgi:hypothetical protein
MDRPLRARSCISSPQRSDIEGLSPILPPLVTTLYLSIDRSGLTHPISTVKSLEVNQSIDR